MLLEALVISVCAGGGSDGCTAGTSAYYEQSTALKDFSKVVERKGREITNNAKWIVYVGPPIYSIATRKPASILVYRGTTLKIDPWSQSLGFQWNY